MEIVSEVFILQILVLVIFSAYVLLDLASIFARPAGFCAEKNALGYTFLTIINTIKRVFIVLYPPIIGVIAIIGEKSELLFTIISCYAVSIIPIFIIYNFRTKLTCKFAFFIDLYARTGLFYKSFLKTIKDQRLYLFRYKKKANDIFKPGSFIHQFDSMDKYIFALSGLVFLFYTSSLFIVNLFGAYFSTYAPIIFQLVGVVNAIGTLIMSFLLDPRLSRLYDRGESIEAATKALFFGNVVSLLFLGPLLLGLCYLCLELYTTYTSF